MNDYDTLYRTERSTVARSARLVVPLVVNWAKPASVVDVGCGTGGWLRAFEEHGIDDVIGVDGPWVPSDQLEVSAKKFIARDLTLPLDLGRRFDLAISLEVAEHLPATAADTFVESLAQLADVVLFSAAIPKQGGPHHVNEQWPEYWSTRFGRFGFVCVDWLRPRLWCDDRIAWYYRQNALCFARPAWLSAHASSAHEPSPPLPLVHPANYEAKIADYRAWIERLHKASAALMETVPPGTSVALLDNGELGSLLGAGYRTRPFPMEAGAFSGAPGDDATALAELERLVEERCEYLVVAWVAFWWLDYYKGFTSKLRDRFALVRQDEELIVFHLNAPVR